MKKILITGGAGFIGSNFIRYFLNNYRDYTIVNLDKLTYAGNKNNLKDCEKDPRYKFVRGDICDKAIVEKLVLGCDAVINFAAESHVDRSIKDPESFMRTNIGGVQVILDAVKKFSIPRFIQISTDEVYGSVKEGYSKETDCLMPSSPYSASKAAGDLLCHSYFVTYETPVVIVRSSNNFGQYQFPEKVIPLFITNALEDKKLPLYADGKNKRDWIYVLDNCEAINCVFQKGKAGQIYNIGGGNEKTNLELTQTILKIMEKPKGLIEFVKDRPGHDKRYAVNSRKLETLGWKPKCDFYKALELTVQWYKDNRTWWRPLKERSV
ncbi:MAG: dTDP-glucose 4,6-dehydratase [Candidatus Omnitrophica bacterium]|nr:dTDP-glucose 4,6-dehydratase [Candidatus Omnitrophota bacterium]